MPQRKWVRLLVAVAIATALFVLVRVAEDATGAGPELGLLVSVLLGLGFYLLVRHQRATGQLQTRDEALGVPPWTMMLPWALVAALIVVFVITKATN